MALGEPVKVGVAVERIADEDVVRLTRHVGTEPERREESVDLVHLGLERVGDVEVGDVLAAGPRRNMDAEDRVRRAHRFADLEERETPASDRIREPGKLRHAGARDGGGRIRVPSRLLLEKPVAVRIQEDEHRLAEVFRALHEQLEIAEVRLHRRRVLHLGKHRGLGAASLSDDR